MFTQHWHNENPGEMTNILITLSTPGGVLCPTTRPLDTPLAWHPTCCSMVAALWLCFSMVLLHCAFHTKRPPQVTTPPSAVHNTQLFSELCFQSCFWRNYVFRDFFSCLHQGHFVVSLNCTVWVCENHYSVIYNTICNVSLQDNNNDNDNDKNFIHW